MRKHPQMKVLGAPIHEHITTRVIDGVTTQTSTAKALKAIGIHEVN